MHCCFRLEIAAEKGGLLAKRFGKALFVFLVARNNYSCLQNCVEWTFVFLSCPEFGILPKFLSGIFLFCFLVCFSTKICPKNSRENPAKSTIFSANLSLQIPWNFTFFPRIIRSPVHMLWLRTCTTKITQLRNGVSFLYSDFSSFFCRPRHNFYIVPSW